MKISIAQTRPVVGDIGRNIEDHKRLIDLALSKADMIFFPELSLTGYDSKRARSMTMDTNDKRLDIFQKISDTHGITIGAGVPTFGNSGILISMIIFQKHQEKQVYSKQLLHADELPYFANGNYQVVLTTHNKKIAPAICYESLQPEHAAEAARLGAEIYVASVAKSENGVRKAFNHFPEIARKHGMVVLMSNCLGPLDDFESVGASAAWNKKGELLGRLNNKVEGILVYNTETDLIEQPVAIGFQKGHF